MKLQGALSKNSHRYSQCICPLTILPRNASVQFYLITQYHCISNMTLDQLTEEENRLMSQVCNTYGTIEEKRNKLEAQGTFSNYEKVHSHYANLAHESNEALKRGLFLQWYVLVEPSFLSGIDFIDADAQRSIFSTMGKRVRQPDIDLELHAMLSYYIEWSVFDHIIEYNSVLRSLEQVLHYDAIIEYLQQKSFAGRGQMGKYWQSILPNNNISYY